MNENLSPQVPTPPESGDFSLPDSSGEPMSILIEVQAQPWESGGAILQSLQDIPIEGLTLDEDYEPVSLGGTDSQSRGGSSVIVHGIASDEGVIVRLRQQPQVIQVWKDTPVAPFTSDSMGF